MSTEMVLGIGGVILAAAGLLAFWLAHLVLNQCGRINRESDAMLRECKTANDEAVRTHEATLSRLDAFEKRQDERFKPFRMHVDAQEPEDLRRRFLRDSGVPEPFIEKPKAGIPTGGAPPMTKEEIAELLAENTRVLSWARQQLANAEEDEGPSS